MKKIFIEVRGDYDVPAIYTGLNVDPELREAALTIGSKAITNSADLEKQKKAFEDEHELALAEVRSMKKKLQSQVDTEMEAKIREAVLVEKEKHMQEREAIIARIEERHGVMLLRSECQHDETRKTLEQLRKEHEGLVLKLMARLEPAASSVRGATSSSASLGRTFEENVQRHLRQIFGVRPDFQLDDVHATGHSGDLIMMYDGLRILVELKSYDPKTRVPTKEVEKLARDLTEVQPPCQAAIMISACSEITGHYSCGPFEVSATVAPVPVLFINNFLSIGEPQVTLHMTRVFLAMVKSLPSSGQEDRDEDADQFKRLNLECSRRCTGYLTDLSHQSAELLRQVTSMKNGASKLKETVTALVENEVARFTGIIQLLSTRETPSSPENDAPSQVADPTPVAVPDSLLTVPVSPVFSTQADLTPQHKDLIAHLSSIYVIGNHEQKFSTKELIGCVKEFLKVKSDHIAREAIKAVFLESVVKHGHIVGIAKKTDQSKATSDP